jgi:hypothetical protein
MQRLPDQLSSDIAVLLLTERHFINKLPEESKSTEIVCPLLEARKRKSIVHWSDAYDAGLCHTRSDFKAIKYYILA